MSRFIPPEIHFGKVYRCNKTNSGEKHIACMKSNREDPAVVRDKDYVIPIKTLYDTTVLLLKGSNLVIVFNSEFISYFDLES